MGIAPTELGSSGQPDPYPVRLADQYDQLVFSRADFVGPQHFGTDFAESLPPVGELITDLPELQRIMGRLAVTAHTAGLAHLRYGLFGYQQVTRECTERLELPRDDPRAFDHPEKIGVTMPHFFNEFVKAAWLHVHGHRQPRQGWHKPFYSPSAQSASPAEAMFEFLTTHVRYDLGVALLRTNTQPEHKDDYTVKVNGILGDVAVDILPHYVHIKNQVLKTLQVDKAGMRMALRELFGARDEAWVSHEQMSGAVDLREFVAMRQSQHDRTEKRLLSSRKMSNLVVRALVKMPPESWPVDKLPVAA